MEMGEKIRILIAEDHAVVRAGFRALLESQPDMVVVGEAANGWEAFEKARALVPDLVLMDISMPGMNGIEATERIKEALPQVKVLVLTIHADEFYLRHLLKAGASGYLVKQSPASELCHAIRTIHAGGVYVDPSLAHVLVDTFIRNGGTAGEELSAREREVLRLVALGYGNKEIACHLHLSVKTVEAYKARIMEKLGLRSRAELVRYALMKGLLEG